MTTNIRPMPASQDSSLRLTGLVAATHTPFREDGTLNLDRVEDLAGHLDRHGISGVFIGGTTGESMSLTTEERRRLARRWAEVVQGTSLRLVVHVGHNCLADAQQLAGDAEGLGAHAIAALSPHFFKPASLDQLIGFCRAVSARASSTPFYYYDIPGMTGVHLSTTEFLEKGRDLIPRLSGIKYTNPDLAMLQECLAFDDGAFDILYGNDETLSAGLGLGIAGAIGSTYNFCAPISHRVMESFRNGDFKTMQSEQRKTLRVVRICSRYHYMAAAKTIMKFLGIDCGPVRPPLRPLTEEETRLLWQDLEAEGFFDWIQTNTIQ